jgi:hypothetical protein
MVQDRGFFLRMDHRVVFLESSSNRYELSRQTENPEVFRWAKCVEPHKHNTSFLEAQSLPLTEEHVEVTFYFWICSLATLGFRKRYNME